MVAEYFGRGVFGKVSLRNISSKIIKVTFAPTEEVISIRGKEEIVEVRKWKSVSNTV